MPYIMSECVSRGRSVLCTKLSRLQTSLFTKGVASVRSPVRNLAHFVPDVSHEGFVQAMARAFAEEFDGSGEVRAAKPSVCETNSPSSRFSMSTRLTWNTMNAYWRAYQSSRRGTGCLARPRSSHMSSHETLPGLQ